MCALAQHSLWLAFLCWPSFCRIVKHFILEFNIFRCSSIIYSSVLLITILGKWDMQIIYLSCLVRQGVVLFYYCCCTCEYFTYLSKIFLFCLISTIMCIACRIKCNKQLSNKRSPEFEIYVLRIQWRKLILCMPSQGKTITANLNIYGFFNWRQNIFCTYPD